MANAELIKKLRENTGCGMSDCNKALKECNDDYEKAIEWLRKKGLSSAAKKSTRVTAEGVVGIENKGNVATILEVNSETDFVARNDKFQDLYLIQYWSDFVKYVGNDADYNTIDTISI